MNKICPHCGDSLPENASFCPHCAQGINARTEAKPPRPVQRMVLRMGILLLFLMGIALGSYLYQAPQSVDGVGEVLYSDEDGAYQLLLGYADSRYKPLAERVESVEAGIEYCVPSSLFINFEDSGADAKQDFLQKIEHVTTELIQPADNASPMTCTEPATAASALEAAMISNLSFTGQSSTAELLWTINMKNGDRIRLHQTYTPELSEAVPNTMEERRISTPTDGEHFFLELIEDENGDCTVTRDRVQAEFPEVQSFSLSGAPSQSGNLDDYLSNTYHMSRLVASGGTAGSDDQYGMFSAKNDSTSTRCLFLFSDLTTLCGYAVGPPERVAEGVWRLEVTSCDYDFSALYQERAQSFAAAEMPAYIPPKELSTCGAEWFLYAFNMREDSGENKNTQLFYLWNQSASPYLEHHLRDIGTLGKRLPRGDQSDPRYTYYYLFDENQTLIGYTRLSSRDTSVG